MLKLLKTNFEHIFKTVELVYSENFKFKTFYADQYEISIHSTVNLKQMYIDYLKTVDELNPLT